MFLSLLSLPISFVRLEKLCAGYSVEGTAYISLISGALDAYKPEE